VRAAPKRKMAVDWEGLTMGGGATSAAIENASMRAVEARSPAWMRGGSLAVREGERGREKERRARWRRAARQGRGVQLGAAWRARTEMEELPRARRGTARHRPGRGARVARRGTSHGRPNRGGEKGLTGGPQPQCQATTPVDRRA
jgi:hypothetical protein